MKKRKNNKEFPSRKMLNKIADNVNSIEYKFEKLKEFAYGEMFIAAKNGKYTATIDITEYDNEIVDKLKDELLRDNITCYSYSLSKVMPVSNIYSMGETFEIKYLDVCWNTEKAFVNITK